MHILHVIDTTGPGGAETVFIELADKLRLQGYKSSVLIRGPGWVQDELERRGLDMYVLDAKGSMNVSYLKAMVSLVNTLQVDLIQSHLLGSNLYCSLLSFITRKPLVATFHGMVDVAQKERFLNAKFGIMNLFADRFAMVSQQMQDLFVSNYRLNQKKCAVIYNGIDVERYKLPKNNQLRQGLNLSDDTVLVGCLGNVRPAKAYELLVEVAAQVQQRGLKMAFVVAGDRKASLMKKLEVQMQRLNVSGSIHFIGFIDDTAEYLSNLDVFLLCSSSEGFSISTIEAMAAGLPVIATRCGGPEEIISNDKNGYLVKNGSADEIVAKLELLSLQPDIAKALAAQGQLNAKQRFGIDVMLEQYLSIYHELLKR